MKTIKLILFVTIISSIISSCRKGGPFGIRGKGSNVTETKNLSGFDRIHLSIDADVFYTQDSVYKVEITAQTNILAVLKAEVVNNTLKFEYRRNVWDHNQVKITVHSPNISEFNLSGNGDITAQNTLTTTSIDLNLSGSGKVFIPALKATNLKASISGIGDLKIAGGSLKNESLDLSGFGDMDFENVQTETCSIKLSGAGKAIVNVTEKLDATISGIGDVKYRGRPTITSDISGSGKLIPLD